MDNMTIWSSISNSFLKGVHTEFSDRDSGGPECAKYMSLEFRLGCTVIMVRINFSSLINRLLYIL